MEAAHSGGLVQDITVVDSRMTLHGISKGVCRAVEAPNVFATLEVSNDLSYVVLSWQVMVAT